ncbi:E1-E2 ATPase-domain-containing protein [Amylocarpus encephaloides]|uniref:E1-E2 ATPase-domain-containing protein n=1 Tax=Amylocarpus encephaloides TaxID=45428 RepID=A0A9P7Y874_9HELO|nr:E1-E2 ATPase-domain-containing protein [Amylocarpus encephaloides]
MADKNEGQTSFLQANPPNPELANPALNPPSTGCCVDCGSGRTRCDDSCIRKLALIKCRTTCGTDHDRRANERTTLGTRDHSLPAKQNDGCIEAVKITGCEKDGCCAEKKDGSNESCGVEKKNGMVDDCCAENKDVAEDNCCATMDTPKDTCEKGDCCAEEKDVAKQDAPKDTCEKGDCCAEEKDVAKQDAPKDACEKDGCCAEEKDVAKQDAPKDACEKDGCCAEEKDVAKGNCCAKQDAPKDTCEKDDCCVEKKNDLKDNPRKDGCCVENSSICNNNVSDKPKSSESTPCGKKQSTTEACVEHLQQAFNEYSSYLDKGRCICRSVLDRLDTCCGQTVSKSQAIEHSSTPVGYSSALANPRQPSLRRSTKKSCEETCCDAAPIKTRKNEEASSCGLDDVAITYAPSRKHPSTRNKEVDLEDAGAREHVLLGVSGMTCTGCSRRMTNVLHTIEGVSAIKVTFVTGAAEFDLDLAMANLQQVLPRIEKETGFKCSQIVSAYQVLDLTIDPALAKGVSEQLRGLVESVEKIDKWTYRVNYDPALMGARSLLSSVRGASLAPPGNDATLADGRRRLIQIAWSTGVAAVLTIPVLVLAWSDTAAYSRRSIVSLVLATFVQALAVPEFYIGAVKSLVYSRVLETDMLVVISITAAYVYSLVAFSLTHAGYPLETEEFWETSTLLITLLLLGRLVAAIAKVKAVSAVSLRSLQAEKAFLVEASGDTTEMDARLLQFGDVFLIPAHGRVVTDGVVTSGQSSVDESMITGESVPVPKAAEDEVIAGTINGPSALTIRMTRLPGKNSITDIANLVESALASKPRIQDLADRVASYFVPVVITIALVVFAIWVAVGVEVRGKNGGGSVGLAVSYSIAVLAISCPCALGLAVPMVLVMAGGVAARNGVIIKQADAIERGYKVTDVVFDKTGTITKGDLTVVHEQFFPHGQASENDIFSLATSVTKDNQHPVSLAVAALMERKGDHSTTLENVESIPGAGIQCTWRKCHVQAGNPYWLKIEDRPEITSLLEQGMTLFCLTLDSKPVATFGLKSNIRDEAQGVIADLQRRNIKCHIVSGDGPRVVEDVANAVGIPASNMASRHSPVEKQKYVQGLMSAGKHVLFCGDGTNDAVAVAQANVGVQIGTASDVTRATADVVLLGGLDGVPMLLDLSGRAFRRIAFNFAWSAIYNLFAILLAAGAFVKVRIPPAYAGLGEIVSISPVIVAAMTLLRAQNTR